MKAFLRQLAFGYGIMLILGGAVGLLGGVFYLINWAGGAKVAVGVTVFVLLSVLSWMIGYIREQ